MPETAFLEVLMKAVEVTDDCTACGLCEAVAPEVFHVTDAGSALRTDDPAVWSRGADGIRTAARLCPSDAIHYST